MIAKLKGKAPYSGVMTNGFVMDERGLNFKMSKSFGNVVDPRTIIEGGNNPEAENVVLYDHLSQIDQHALFQLETLLKTSKQVTKVISSSKYSKLSLYFI